jgi:hypothetical protein
MKVKSTIPKKKYQTLECEVCHKVKICTWHHIGHRRYSNKWIWACVFDGKEGCHEKIHRDVEWAYQEGYLVRTPRGREATEKAYKHLGKSFRNNRGSLFD